MAYREVTVVELREVLRLWIEGRDSVRRIARLAGVDPKTVKRYIDVAVELGLTRGQSGLSDVQFEAVAEALCVRPVRAHGEAWAACEARRAFIEQKLGEGVRLTKVRKLLARHGTKVPYATLHRFAVQQLDFGRTAATVPIADCAPGEELQLDTGWVGALAPDLFGKRRKFRAWIFTSVATRHRFVWPCFGETTETAIEACEQAWKFFGGVFRVVIPDNTKTIVNTADQLGPKLNRTFFDYAQSRGFHIDAARSRTPTDKGRVERAVQTVRDDCFGGEVLQSLDHARARAASWCSREYGTSKHTRTQRMPLEHFDAEEKPRLLPPPAEPYDVPLWCEPKVARDHLAQVAKALYSLPTAFIGKRLTARADRSLVRFYDGAKLVKTHPRVAPGQKSIDPNDFPPEKRAYAMRDVDFLKRHAREHGAAIGAFAEKLLDTPLPWTRMRQVYALLGMCKRFGAERVEEQCRRALDAEMHDIKRLERMVKGAVAAPSVEGAGRVIPIAKYLRPESQYRLPLASRARMNPKDKDKS